MSDKEKFKELFLFTKDFYRMYLDEYDKLGDKAYKTIPIIAIIVGIFTYQVKWIFEIVNGKEFDSILILLFILTISIFITSSITLFLILRSLLLKKLEIISIKNQDVEFFTLNEIEGIYHKYSELFVQLINRNLDSIETRGKLIQKSQYYLLTTVIFIFLFIILYVIYFFINN